MHRCSVIIVFLLATPMLAWTEEWSQFRGPLGNGHSQATGLPVQWTGEDNISWKQAIPGEGWSSPVIWGDHIFLTTVISDGDIEAPRMGLYFPYGSPEPSPDFRDPEPGELMEREADVHRWLVYALDFKELKDRVSSFRM